MLSSLLRPKKARRRVQESPLFSSPYAGHAAADFTEDDEEDDERSDDDRNNDDEEEEEEEDQENSGAEDEDQDQDEDDGEGEDEDGDSHTPLLPIFSAAHLDALPVYNLTHAIRLIIVPRTETTLTWDQLRSPQVSSFLIKPMQQQIRTSHFSRASLYALMANCLQFQKESQANPGNAGNSRTRAMVCELIAVKLLKEYNTRELIDALSYDFFPLQGLAIPGNTRLGQNAGPKPRPAAARISTLEVAIRASAKRFLAHPLVVQQLEAIWAGTIVFHSAADNLHRRRLSTSFQEQRRETDGRTPLMKTSNQQGGYGSMVSPNAPNKALLHHQEQAVQSRRTVTLYDPRDASLFKLSRLRVPRYQQFFSTGSLFILLCLFVAVLAQRSVEITTLEVVFWFWSAGFMLDEVVGFNEQGFGLYIMSFWNAFDLGILLLLSIYYCMRLYGVLLVGAGRHQWNSMAYDVLATNAILLFPRLFSVLDHYRYFSQLLIAFRLMAVDLVAVFVLILIACSGFFVAFTLSFGEDHYDAAGVAYKIFQILMGFTPAAWEAWPTYNPLGKALLVLFLFICHFLVVTILITVLTNSFMAIVSNADQEHQFVFAVNTISMVKNDALFSYVAPSNIFAWLLTPLRFVIPFRSFIKVNRTFIKATHFPLLFTIFAYEKVFLARTVFEPTDLVENPRRGRKRLVSFQDAKMALFSPSIRLRQGSIARYQNENALDEVFRLAPPSETLRTGRKHFEETQTNSVVNNWMNEGTDASPPQEQDRSIVDRLEKRRKARKATLLRQRGISGTRSIASDPAEFMSRSGFHDDGTDTRNEDAQETEDDGDDEANTHDGEEAEKETAPSRSHGGRASYKQNDMEGYFAPQLQARMTAPPLSSSAASVRRHVALPRTSPPQQRRAHHNRTMSTGTILFNPINDNESSASPPKSRPLTAKYRATTNTGTHTPAGLSGHQTPKQAIPKTKPRPILPARQNFKSVPNFNLDPQLAGNATRNRQIRHRRSSLDMGMSDMGLDNNQAGMLGAVPSSFATQMAMATGGLKAFQGSRSKEADTERMMGRLMLARMKTLEESFADVVKEFRGMRTVDNSSIDNESVEQRRDKGKGREKEKSPSRKRKIVPKTTSQADNAIVQRGRSDERYDGPVQDADLRVSQEEETSRRYTAKGSSF
ncbi:hypothetical protein WAI453_010995 [Rhynchosporium graminicola]|uniref:Related to YVC1-vacuolar cation channel n=1 Tax=Rhynchosporium graminicola TaxID=2792576 RepID=A0A1E1LNE1_9HELO|nr:related to YVC1-vacuolar cation channel [Rhynchosporium commune]